MNRYDCHVVKVQAMSHLFDSQAEQRFILQV